MDRERQPDSFRIRRYEVSVRDYRPEIILATTRGKAMADAWRCGAFDGITFGEFLTIARCRLTDYQITPKPITVLGKPAFYIDHNNQYVQFVYAGGEVVLNAHPLDVLPVECRPKAYQGTGDTPSIEERP